MGYYYVYYADKAAEYVWGPTSKHKTADQYSTNMKAHEILCTTLSIVDHTAYLISGKIL